MTIKELIDNFGNKFGLTIEDEDDYYLNARYLNNVPLEKVWNDTEDNPYLEVESILNSLDDTEADYEDNQRTSQADGVQSPIDTSEELD